MISRMRNDSTAEHGHLEVQALRPCETITIYTGFRGRLVVEKDGDNLISISVAFGDGNPIQVYDEEGDEIVTLRP